MIDTREIEDTPIDRAAMAILLPFVRPTSSLRADTAEIGNLDDAWFILARDLGGATEARVNDILQRIADAEQSDPANMGAERAGALMALIIDWRHGIWEAAEIAAGRDPHQTV